LVLFHEKVGEELAHGIQAVLHRDMLLAAIFKVGRRAHQLDCFRPVSLTMCKPRLCGEDLYADLAGPVRLARLLERRLELLQFPDVGWRSGKVAAARSAQRACEVDDGLGRWRIDCGGEPAGLPRRANPVAPACSARAPRPIQSRCQGWA